MAHDVWAKPGAGLQSGGMGPVGWKRSDEHHWAANLTLGLLLFDEPFFSQQSVGVLVVEDTTESLDHW